MAKGSLLKEEITQKILEVFPESFIDGKEIRICGTENSEQIQIKVALTCAKTNIECGSAAMTPDETGTISVSSSSGSSGSASIFPSDEEKKNVADLVARLGLA